MDEIVNQVSARTGLPPDQARAVVEVVVGLLKERLPGPAAQALQTAVGTPNGAGQAGSAPAGLLGTLKRMLGGG